MSGDPRFAYGAACGWFGPVGEAGTTRPRPGMANGGAGAGLPCCPRCGGMLFEVGSSEVFWEAAEVHDRAGHPGYLEMLRWVDAQLRAGGHFRDYAHAAEAYRRRTGKDVRA